MIDLKDIVPVMCDECGTFGPHENAMAYGIEGRDEIFCSYECAEQFVNNHNADEAERKAER